MKCFSRCLVVLAIVFQASLAAAGSVALLGSGKFSGIQLDLDFASNTGNVAPSAAMSVVRSGTANALNTSGGLTSFGANTLRFCADEARWDAAGICVEQATTNLLPNPTFTGGSAGVMPTGFARSSFDGSGLTVTVNSVTSTQLSITITGTANNGFFGLDFSTAAAVGVTIGQTLTCSASMQVSSTTGISQIGLGVVEYTAGGFNGAYTLGPAGQTSSDIPWQTEAHRTITTGNTAVCGLGFQTDASGTVNATILIQRPQFELSNIRTTFASTTRAADAVSLSSTYATQFFASAGRSICVGFDGSRGSSGTILSLQKDASNYVEIRSTNSLGASTLSLFVVSGGSTLQNSTVGYSPPMARNKLCVVMTVTTITTQVNNEPAIAVTVTAPTGLTSLLLGSGNNGYANATFQTLKTWTRALPAADTALNAGIAPALSDSFARANSASFGTAPTGQAWTQTGSNLYSIVSNFAVQGTGTLGAVYLMATLQNIPVYMGHIGRWTNASSGGTGALISANGPPVLANPTLTATHIINIDTQIISQYIGQAGTASVSVSGTVLTVTGYSGTDPILAGYYVIGSCMTGGVNAIVSLGSGTGGNGTYNLGTSEPSGSCSAGFNGVATPVPNFFPGAPAPLDGSTLYGWAWFARTDSSIVQLGTQGEMPRGKATKLTSGFGTTLWYEAIGGNTTTSPDLKSVYAR